MIRLCFSLYFALLFFVPAWAAEDLNLSILPGYTRDMMLAVFKGVRNYTYDSRMEMLFRDLHSRRFSADISLTTNEQIVNCYLRRKVEEMQKPNQTASDPPIARSFISIKEAIKTNDLFAVLKDMPKGGLLHLHGSSAGRIEWVITNAVIRPECYIYWPSNNAADRGKLAFPTDQQMKTNAARYTNYLKASTLREELKKDGKSLDEQLRFLFTMTPGPNGSTGWARFGECFGLIGDLATYHPVALDYLQDAFEHLCAESVDYVELRISKGTLYDAERTWEGDDFLRSFEAVRDRVRKKYSNFDLKLILCDWRGSDPSALQKKLPELRSYFETFTNLIVGYDLIGEEDGMPPAVDYSGMAMDLLENIQGLNLYLHEGESAWAEDENLVAAILLEPKRFGHAFNLFRFPVVEDLVISKNIALEVCPISNQLLGYTPDLRVHPAAGYLNRGIQCVLGSDDPLIFANEGLTYDFWIAFVAWNLDLSALKKLALNSLTYSGLKEDEKKARILKWENQWSNWITKTKTLALEAYPDCAGKTN
jgi:adenosine deaminase CECR1